MRIKTCHLKTRFNMDNKKWNYKAIKSKFLTKYVNYTDNILGNNVTLMINVLVAKCKVTVVTIVFE